MSLRTQESIGGLKGRRFSLKNNQQPKPVNADRVALKSSGADPSPSRLEQWRGHGVLGSGWRCRKTVARERDTSKPGSISSLGLAENFYPRDGMDLIPAIVAISNVGAGNADVIADIGSGYSGDEAFACRPGLIFDRRMIADHLNDEVTLCMHYVCQIQD